MHLGQTATFLSGILNRQEPTVQMVARLMREKGWAPKGARGKHAPHIDDRSLANFLIAMMACPDAPSIAMQRLPHFSNLPLDRGGAEHITFAEALAVLLRRLAAETWQEAQVKGWCVILNLHFLSAEIVAVFEEDGVREEHLFAPVFDDERPAIDSMPYFGGLEVTSKVRGFTLFRIAKVVLAGDPDPIDEIRAEIMAECG